ncbi:hypothetical protein L2E82_30769 [Cichorium intybus]|uniref:Uncharacterized protein n=1 Tax=Cichorium intybus TaxID=13427 RepID=A0ACB9D1F5_CICIN|nr:hypothetical protein L2E82_30769 [Cichorium intybus]
MFHTFLPPLHFLLTAISTQTHTHKVCKHEIERETSTIFNQFSNLPFFVLFSALTDERGHSFIYTPDIRYWFSIFPPSSSASGQLAFKSVPDLEKSMYMVMDGYPCVRLLNLSGEIGCANLGLDKVVASVIRFKNGIELVKPSSVAVPLSDFDNLLSRVSSDSNFAKNLAGVLVESGLQNQTHTTVKIRVQKPLVSPGEKLISPSTCSNQPTKRQKLEIGYLRCPIEVPHDIYAQDCQKGCRN